jgi:outer membrane murein-binding lipoprotein Lpp
MTQKKINTPELDWKSVVEKMIGCLEMEKLEIAEKVDGIDGAISDLDAAVEDLENALEQAEGLL